MLAFWFSKTPPESRFPTQHAVPYRKHILKKLRLVRLCSISNRVTILIVPFNHYSQNYEQYYPVYSLCVTLFFFFCVQKAIKEITNNPHWMHCNKAELLYELTRAECNIARFMLCFRSITWSSPILGRYTWPCPSSLASTTCEWTQTPRWPFLPNAMYCNKPNRF